MTASGLAPKPLVSSSTRDMGYEKDEQNSPWTGPSSTGGRSLTRPASTHNAFARMEHEATFNPFDEVFSQAAADEAAEQRGSAAFSWRQSSSVCGWSPRRRSRDHDDDDSDEKEEEDDLPLEELQFGAGPPSHHNPSGRRRRSSSAFTFDRATHQEQAFRHLSGDQTPTIDITPASPSTVPRAARSRGSRARDGAADRDHLTVLASDRHDLHGGKSKAELYAAYDGESPLGPEQISLGRPRRASGPASASATRAARRPSMQIVDVEHQAPKVARKPIWGLETKGGWQAHWPDPLVRFVERRPGVKMKALVLASFGWQFVMAAVALCCVAGIFTISAWGNGKGTRCDGHLCNLDVLAGGRLGVDDTVNG